MDTYAIENGPNSEYGDGYKTPYEGNVKSIPELQELFGSMGISKDKTVVVYTDDEISMMTAGRAAWALLLAGVEDVRILNGRYDAWQNYGGEEETTPNPWVATAFGSSDGHPEYLATTDDFDEQHHRQPARNVFQQSRATPGTAAVGVQFCFVG